MFDGTAGHTCYAATEQHLSHDFQRRADLSILFKRQAHSSGFKFNSQSFPTLLVNWLEGPRWLNDDLIAFIFHYNQCERFKEHSATFLYVPPSITQLVKLLPEDDQSTLIHLGAEDKQILFLAESDNVGATQAGFLLESSGIIAG